MGMGGVWFAGSSGWGCWLARAALDLPAEEIEVGTGLRWVGGANSFLMEQALSGAGPGQAVGIS